MWRTTTIRGYDVLAMALVLGLGGGLFEGVVHMVIQRFMLENVWYPIIWIAAVFNGLLLAALAGALTLALAFRPVRDRGRSLVVFSLVFAAWLPCITLMLKAWIHPAAILALAIGSSVAATRAIHRHEHRAFELFRRGVPAMVALTLLTCVAIEGGFGLRERILTRQLPTAREGSPDVLLLIVDTLRADHLPSYGYGKATTANMDRLAADGVLFERAFSTSSYTLPAHVSILTGLYPQEHGVEWMTSKKWGSTSYSTLPEILQGHGYRTGAFSGNTFWVSREHGFGRGFLHFEDFFHSPQDMAFRTAYGRLVTTLIFPRFGWRDIPARKLAEDTNRALLEWMNQDPDRPVFAMVNYFDVHDPYRPRGLVNSQLGTPDTLTPDELRDEVDAYDRAIRYVDGQIGDLLTRVRQRGGRDLLVVVTSDHGEEFGEHGWYGHGNHLYREAIEVPLLVWGPGRVPEGRRVSIPVTIASIPATIMDLLGLEGAKDASPSVRPLWSAETPSEWPAPLLALAHRPWDKDDTPIRHGSMRSLVKSNWHFIDHDALGPQLYDFVRDPSEQRNLVREAEHQHLVRQFRDQLAEYPR